MSNEDVTFTRGPARRPAPVVQDPLIQWATGLQTRERRIYAGWFVEAGKLDDLDAAMDAAGIARTTIKHGNGNMVTHWTLPTANLFVIAEGVQSMGEMKHTEERFGIAFGWRTLEDGRKQSALRCRVFLRELLEVGYEEPLLLTLKSTLTGDLLTALMRQYDVLDALAAFRRHAELPAIDLPYYACSIAIGPGHDVSRGQGSMSREIAPPVAMVSDPVSKEYIQAHWTKKDWVRLIEAQLDDTIRWSKETSLLIGAGEEPREEY